MPTIVVFASDYGRITGRDDVYATAQEVAVLVSLPVSSTYGVGQSKDTISPLYRCFELFLTFDTSILLGQILTTAQLFLNVASNSATDAFVLESRLAPWTPTLALGDFLPASTQGTNTLLCSFNTSAIPASLPAYIKFDDNALANNISTSGSTDIAVCSSRHRLGNLPTGLSSESVSINTPDAAGTDQDPKLLITYTPTSPALGGALVGGNCF